MADDNPTGGPSSAAASDTEGTAPAAHTPGTADSELIPDPVFLQSVRESGVILLTWLACFVWTFSYCALNAYPKDVDPATLPTVLGMPAWVVWGIVLPWSLANVVTLVFTFCFMQDADLDAAADPVLSMGADHE